MRRDEIFKKVQGVNFELSEIYISQTNTKTEDARMVRVTPRLREELEKLWEVSPKDLESLVFGKIDPIKTSWKTAYWLTKVTDFSFQDCRYTATTRMIASGSAHTEVMKITEYTQLKTFLRYLNIITETASRVTTKLSDYLTEK